MTYVKTSWQAGVTALGPVSLNKVESGIADAHQRIDKTLTGVDDPGALSLAASASAPSAAPTATVSAGTGLGVGAFVYAVTYITGHVRDDSTLEVRGETTAGPTVSATTTAGNQRVSLTNIPTSAAASVIGKRVYRSAVGGGQRKLVVTLATSATTYTDTTPDANLGANEPTANTTGTTFAAPVVEVTQKMSVKNAAPYVQLIDTTASARSARVIVDGNQLRWDEVDANGGFVRTLMYIDIATMLLVGNADQVDGIHLRYNATLTVLEYSTDGTTWVTAGLTASKVRAIARRN